MDFKAALGILQSRTPRIAGPPPCLDGTGETDPAPLPPITPAALTALSLSELLLQLLSRQDERVAAYQRFEAGFELFLQVPEAEGYEALVQISTARFREISDSVLAIETELRSRERPAPELATVVRRLQEQERDKLALTAQLHIVRHGLAIDSLREEAELDGAGDGGWRRASAMRAEERAELEGKLAALTAELNDTLDEVRCELADCEADP